MSLKTCVVFLFVAFITSAQGQQRVERRNTYERLMAIVPIIGSGTFADPFRPMYAPLPSALKTTTPATRGAIVAYTFVKSDDGKSALVEFAARDRSAFAPIIGDKSVKAFLKGKDKAADAEAAFKQYKKNFDITKFGVRMP